MPQFKDDVRTRISGTTEKGAELHTTKTGMVCGVRVRSNVRTGTIFTDFVVWGDAKHDNAQRAADAMRVAGRRVVGVGYPKVELYQGNIQHKLTVEDLWVEMEENEPLVQVLEGNGVVEEPLRELKPLEMPVNVRF